MRGPDGFRRATIGLAVFGVAALTLAACSSSKESSSSTSTTVPAKPTVQAAYIQLTGVSTGIDLDATTIALFKQNNITVAPVLPATAGNAGATITFPITGGYIAVYPQSAPSYVRGAVSHSGGLTFSSPGKTLTVTDFVANTGYSVVTSTVGGKESVTLLDLDGSAVKVTTDAQGQTHLDGAVAKLTQAAADALNRTFRVTAFKAGLPLGTVHVVAAGPAGPKEGTPDTELIHLTGVRTSVDVDPGTAQVLKENKVTVTPVAPATGSSSAGGATSTTGAGGTTTTAAGATSSTARGSTTTTTAGGGATTLTFPISGGYVAVYPKSQAPYVRGLVSHTGGLTFSSGGKSLTVTDFMVNPGTSELFGTVSGRVPSVVKLLTLDGSQLKVSTDSQGQVHLDGTVALFTSQLALALNQAFGVAVFKEGIPLGVVHIVATGVEGPK